MTKIKEKNKTKQNKEKEEENKMGEFKIHLQRSHWNQLVAVASDADTGGEVIFNQGTWATPNDGGGYSKVDNFVAVFGISGGKGEDWTEYDPYLYAFVVTEGWVGVEGKNKRTLLRRKPQEGDKDLVLEDGVLPLAVAAYYAAAWSPSSTEGYVGENVYPEHWEEIPPSSTEYDIKIMDKAISIVRELFGQGGRFFEI